VCGVDLYRHEARGIFRSKLDISCIGWEEDIVLEVCRQGEKVCLQHSQGVRFPFTLFEADVLMYLNMAPSQHQLIVGPF